MILTYQTIYQSRPKVTIFALGHISDLLDYTEPFWTWRNDDHFNFLYVFDHAHFKKSTFGPAPSVQSGQTLRTT